MMAGMCNKYLILQKCPGGLVKRAGEMPGGNYPGGNCPTSPCFSALITDASDVGVSHFESRGLMRTMERGKR